MEETNVNEPTDKPLEKKRESRYNLNGTPNKKYNPKKRSSQEEQEKLDRKIIGLNGSDEIFCG